VLPYVSYQPGFMDRVKKNWWKFVILGMYGIYLQTIAFKYNSVASNQVCHFNLIFGIGIIVVRYRYSARATTKNLC